jgi:hypothetical protein
VMRVVMLTWFSLWAFAVMAQGDSSLDELQELVRRQGEPCSQKALLRIRNSSRVTDIHNLTVFFPKGGIEFGDISAGATTGYQEAPCGVYPYAAYRLEIDGEVVAIPVIDWVGAVPLDGARFTYQLEPVTSGGSFRPKSSSVRLVKIVKDE